MKAKLIFVIALLSTTLLGQDYQSSQHHFNSGYLSSDSKEFKQRDFMLGWHWAGGKKITHSLNVMQVDGDSSVNALNIVDSCDIFVRPVEYSDAADGKILNARAIQYEPTLLLHPDKPDSLIIRQGDTTRPVFGFLYRRGRILTDSTAENFNRLIIDSAALEGDSILFEPRTSNQFPTQVQTYFVFNWDINYFETFSCFMCLCKK